MNIRLMTMLDRDRTAFDLGESWIMTCLLGPNGTPQNSGKSALDRAYGANGPLPRLRSSYEIAKRRESPRHRA